MFASKKKKIQQYLNQKTPKTGGASPSPTQYDGVSKSLPEGAFHSSLSRGFRFAKNDKLLAKPVVFLSSLSHFLNAFSK